MATEAHTHVAVLRRFVVLKLTRMLLCSQAFCGAHRYAVPTVLFVGSLVVLADILTTLAGYFGPRCSRAGRRGGDERGRARARAAWIRPFDVVPAREALKKCADISPRARWTCPFARGVVIGESRTLKKDRPLRTARRGHPVLRERTTRPVLSGDAARKRTYAGRKIFLLRCTP